MRRFRKETKIQNFLWSWNFFFNNKWFVSNFLCLLDHEETVKYLLKSGVYIDPIDIIGRTPLHWSVYNGSFDLFLWFLQTYSFYSFFLSKIGNENITKILIEYQCSVNAKDRSGESAIHIAAENGNFCTNSSE